MTNPASAGRRVAFGRFIVDCQQRVIEKDGQLLRLSPKLMETLIVLVENAGRVVPKEEILARVWPDTIVEETGLQRNISLLRKALEEHGAADVIETVPKRGYLFKGEIRAACDPRPEPVAPVSVPIAARRTFWSWWVGGALVLAMAAMAIAFLARQQLAFRSGFSRDGGRLYVISYQSAFLPNVLQVFDLDSKRPLLRADIQGVQDFVVLDDDTLLMSFSGEPGIPRGTSLAVFKLDFSKQTLTEVQRIADWPYFRAYELSASADGRTVTLVRDQTQSDIYLSALEIRTHILKNVRRMTLDDAFDRPVSWLPDNRTLLFHSNRDFLGMYRQRIDEPRAERLRDPGGHDFRDHYMPVSTRDGQWLLHLSGPRGEMPSDANPVFLMRRPMDGSQSSERLHATTDEIAGVFCATHADRCVFAEGSAGKTSFFEVDVQRGTLRALFTLPVKFPYGFNWSLSPDGKAIAYALESTQGLAVGVRDIDSRGARLTSIPVGTGGILRSVVWDARGTGLYVMQCMGEAGVLMHLDLQGGATVLRRQHTSCDGWAVPSPDGNHLAFVEFTSTGNVWLLRR